MVCRADYTSMEDFRYCGAPAFQGLVRSGGTASLLVQVWYILKRSVLLSIRVVSCVVFISLREGFTMPSEATLFCAV
jgi:hypothetical protein